MYIMYENFVLFILFAQYNFSTKGIQLNPYLVFLDVFGKLVGLPTMNDYVLPRYGVQLLLIGLLA